MGLTKRKDSYYVEFPVIHNGEKLKLARGMPGAKLKRWKVGCRNKEEARKQEAIIRTQLLQGLPTSVPTQAPPLTLAEYAETWLKTAKANLAARTFRSYRQLIRLHILPALGERGVASLSWADVKTLLNERQQGGLGPNSVRLIRAVVSSMLTDAAEEGHIPSNPVLGQRRKRRAHQVLTTEVCPLNWEQKQAFETALKALEERQLLHASYVMLLRSYLKAGLRPGEGRALQPGDLDFQGKRLRVERSATLGGAIKHTKTGETRWVDVSDGLLAELRSYVTLRKAEDLAAGRTTTWLFPSLTGTFLDERHVVRAFHRVLEAAGLPKFRVYDLRHTFASLLLSANVPLLYVSQQLGHTKPTITLKYYARWIASGQVHRVNVLDSVNTVITPAASSYEEATSVPA